MIFAQAEQKPPAGLAEARPLPRLIGRFFARLRKSLRVAWVVLEWRLRLVSRQLILALVAPPVSATCGTNTGAGELARDTYTKLKMKDQVVSETSISREQIAAMAYEVWEKAGRPQGRDWECWFEAERKLQESMKKAAATPAPTQPAFAAPSPRENTVAPVARIEPARVASTPIKPSKSAARKSPGTLGGGRSRA
jgi:hypothetical protein